MPPPSKLASSLSSKFSLSDETLYRLTAYLGTLSGTDKALMFLQYAPLLLLPALPAMPVPSAKLPIRPRGLQQLRLSLQALSSAVGDSRILFRLFGIVPILAWHRRLQRQRQAKAARANDPSATKAGGGLAGALLSRADIPSLQVSAMLAFYPMEHIWYLASKGVYPLGHAKIFKVAIWSCRAWAAYVALSLVVLRRDQLALRKQATSLSPEELEDKMMSLGLRALTELSYLPLTAHWSLESGLWTSSWFTGLFGTLAAIGQLQSGWRATALPKGASKPAEVAAAATKPSANAATEEVTAAVAAAEVKAKHEKTE